MTKTIERAALLAFALGVVGACGGAKPAEEPVGTSATAGGERVAYDFDSLDDRPVSADAMHGRPTVITFVQLGSALSQAQVEYLAAMAKNDGGTTNYAVVALEPRSNRELLELYVKTLDVTFPAAFADEATLNGAGAFGEWHRVPTTIVLDRVGRVLWRADARVATSNELRNAMKRRCERGRGGAETPEEAEPRRDAMPDLDGLKRSEARASYCVAMLRAP